MTLLPSVLWFAAWMPPLGNSQWSVTVARDILLQHLTWLISSMPDSLASKGMFDVRGDPVLKS